MYTEVYLKQMGRKINGRLVADEGIDILRLIYLQNDLDLESAQARYNKNNPDRPIKNVQRFEDLPLKQVFYEVDGLIKSIKNNDMKSFKQVRNSYMPQAMLKDVDEDGEDVMVQENELLIEGYDEDYEVQAQEIDKVKERIAYIIKMLHEESKSCGYHLMSYAIAIAAAYERNTQVVGYVINPRDIYIQYQPNHEGKKIKVYDVSEDGKHLYQITQNKNRGADIMQWVKGYKESRDIYRDMVDELIVLCKDVNLPLDKEDPRDYLEDNINQIVSTYLLENRTYMRQLKASLHKETYDSIKNIDIFDYKPNIPKYAKEESESVKKGRRISEIYDNCIKTISLYQAAKHPRIHARDNVDVFKSLKYLFEMHNTTSPIKLQYNEDDLKRLQTQDGFLCYPSGNFVILNVSLYKLHDRDYQSALAIFHENGKVVRLAGDSTQLDFVDFSDLIRYVHSEMNYPKTGSKPKDYGKWLSELV